MVLFFLKVAAQRYVSRILCFLASLEDREGALIFLVCLILVSFSEGMKAVV